MFRYCNILIGLIILFSACEDRVEIPDVELEPKMVVVGHFEPDSLFKIVVSLTKSPTASNDTVSYIEVRPELRDEGEDQFLEILDRVNPTPEEAAQGIPPYYTTSGARAIPGKTYRLIVNPLGISVDAVEAVATVPEAAPDSEFNVDILSRISTVNGFQEVNFRFNMTINDRVHRADFYHLNLAQELLRWRGGNTGGDIIVDQDNPEILHNLTFQITDDQQEVLAYIDNKGVLIKDDNFNGESPTFTFTGSFLYDPRRYILGDMVAELRHTSEDYYLYHSSLVRQVEVQDGFDPIAGAVILFNNIDDGCGIFAGYHPVFRRLEIAN